jgi:hypothetical protein
MTTIYKVLDAEGPKLTVKYSDGTRSMTLELHWDGKVSIDEFLGGMDPLPPVLAPSVDTSGFVGKTGTAQRPIPLSAPPITTPPPPEPGSPQATPQGPAASPPESAATVPPAQPAG